MKERNSSIKSIKCYDPNFFMFSCFILKLLPSMCRILLFTSSFQCFSVPSPHLSFPRLSPPPGPDPLVSVSGLCSPSCLCQFVLSSPVMPPSVFSPMSPCWYVSDLCSLSFHWFVLLLALCLVSLWVALVLPGLFVCVCISFCLIKLVLCFLILPLVSCLHFGPHLVCQIITLIL